MLPDLRQLLDATPVNASQDDYRTAIIDENVLGKSTVSTRLWSWQKLHELYGLDQGLTVFRCFRHLWERDSVGRPLLTILCACARDPLLRMSADLIFQTSYNTVVGSEDFAEAIRVAAPDRFTPKTLKSIGRNLLASWTYSGHLTGGKTRRRAHPVCSPEATVYALVLGRLTGARGPLLFSTFWVALLDAPKETPYDFATEASRRGWIDLRRVGSVVEVGFSKLLAPEEAALRESD
jgi:hypothetical protein